MALTYPQLRATLSKTRGSEEDRLANDQDQRRRSEALGSDIPRGARIGGHRVRVDISGERQRQQQWDHQDPFGGMDGW